LFFEDVFEKLPWVSGKDTEPQLESTGGMANRTSHPGRHFARTVSIRCGGVEKAWWDLARITNTPINVQMEFVQIR
jgi:hypothetical protein